MSLRTYWDLTERERAGLTREEVERWVDVELMTKGVEKVAPLVRVEAPPMPDRRMLFTRSVQGPYGRSRSDIGFELAGDVKRLVGAYTLVHDHKLGTHVAHPVEAGEETVAVECITAAQAQQHHAALEQIRAAKSANERAAQEHQAAVKAQDEALRGMWDDWHAQRETDIRMRRVVSTFQNYVETAGGDRNVAARFLTKLFRPGEIVEAAEWCGVEIHVASEPFEVDEKPKKTAPAVDDDVAF